MLDENIYDDVPPAEDEQDFSKEESRIDKPSAAVLASSSATCTTVADPGSSEGPGKGHRDLTRPAATAPLYSRLNDRRQVDDALSNEAAGNHVSKLTVRDTQQDAIRKSGGQLTVTEMDGLSSGSNTNDDDGGGVYVALTDVSNAQQVRSVRATSSDTALASCYAAADRVTSTKVEHSPASSSSFCDIQDEDLSKTSYFVLEELSPTATAETGRTSRCSPPSSLADEPIYEAVGNADEPDGHQFQGPDSARVPYDDEVWSTNEFEPVAADSQNNPVPPAKSSGSQGDSILGRIAGRLSFRSSKPTPAVIKRFRVNRDKHPVPILPPAPSGLTEQQVKRRYVVESIINIENSYVNSLLRLEQHYVEPLKENPQIISLDKTETIFRSLDDILQCHLMFQVALEERAKNWDTDEKIGGQFVSSFSKAMVLESYAAYVNNFLTSTSLIKRLARERPQFEAFLIEQQRKSPDKVDVVGLMLKPVQRFPQYILQVKDLIKYTRQDHPDCLDLQHALATLESIAFELNERKRASEEKLAAKVVLKKLDIRPASEESCLIRQDDVERVEYSPEGQLIRRKPNRLLLFSDMLVCLRIDSDNKEKYYLKWYAPINLVDYQEAYRPRTHRGSASDEAAGADSATLANYEKLQQELSDLKHDEELLHKIYELVSMLRQPYKGMSTDDVEKNVAFVMREITARHEQLKMIDSCAIQLSVSPLGAGGSSHRAVAKGKRVFQLLSPEVKHDWVLDFRAMKLAGASQNKEGWKGNAEMLKYPLLIKNLSVDVTRDGFQVLCATSVFLTSTAGGLGLQYLWLCGGKEGIGQVTIVCIHANSPYAVESFRACDAPVTAVCQVPGNYRADDDQVWMASGSEVLVFGSVSSQARDRCHTDAMRKLSLPTRVTTMCCSGSYVYVAVADGSLWKYAIYPGSTKYSSPAVCRPCEPSAVNFIVPTDKAKLYCAIDKMVYVISTRKSMSVLECHELAGAATAVGCFAKIGHGLWVSFMEDPTLRMYHAETYEFLQDVNIASAVYRLLPEVSRDRPIFATALTFNQGMLWVGTNDGHILTWPIPVVQGVPRVLGRMSISTNGHCGPVRFMLSVTCSLTSALKVRPGVHVGDPLREKSAEGSDSPSAPLATETAMRRWSTEELPVARSTDEQCTESKVFAGGDVVTGSSDSERAKLRSSSRITPKASKDHKKKIPNIFNRRKTAPSVVLRSSSSSSEGVANAAIVSPGDDLESSSDNDSAGDRSSREIVHATANDPSLRSMYSSLLNLDALDDYRATTELVNSLVPLNVQPAAKILTRRHAPTSVAAQRRSLDLLGTSSTLLTDAIKYDVSSSMVDLRTNSRNCAGGGNGARLLRATRNAQSTWELSTPTTQLQIELENRLRLRESGNNTRSSVGSLHETAEPIYDDVADDESNELEHSDGDSGHRHAPSFTGQWRSSAPGHLLGSGQAAWHRKLRSRWSFDALSLTEEVEEQPTSQPDHDFTVSTSQEDVDDVETAAPTFDEQSKDDDHDSDEEPCTFEANDDPSNGTFVETNVLKTSLVISGGDGYVNYVSGISESQSEATILLWQHTHKGSACTSF